MVSLKGKRTYILAAVQSIPPTIILADEIMRTTSAQGESLIDRIPPEWIVIYLMLILISKVWMRTITTTPPFKKD